MKSLPVTGHGTLAIDLNSPGSYVHWSIFTISVANLVLIAVMVAIFGAALLLPFPGRRKLAAAFRSAPVAEDAIAPEPPADAEPATDPGAASAGLSWSCRVSSARSRAFRAFTRVSRSTTCGSVIPSPICLAIRLTTCPASSETRLAASPDGPEVPARTGTGPGQRPG